MRVLAGSITRTGRLFFCSPNLLRFAVESRISPTCRKLPSTAALCLHSGRSANDTTTTTTTMVDLHAQIHFADESYYNYFHDVAFGSRYDRVLYELIVEERFLEQASSTIPGFRRLSSSSSTAGGVNPIAPTPIDQNTAMQYGLQSKLMAYVTVKMIGYMLI